MFSHAEAVERLSKEIEVIKQSSGEGQTSVRSVGRSRRCRSSLIHRSMR